LLEYSPSTLAVAIAHNAMLNRRKEYIMVLPSMLKEQLKELFEIINNYFEIIIQIKDLKLK